MSLSAGAEVPALSVQHRMHAAEQHFYSDDQRQHLSLLTNISSALNRLNINTHLRINQGDIKAARLRLQRAEEMLINTHRDMKLEKVKRSSAIHVGLVIMQLFGSSNAATEANQSSETNPLLICRLKQKTAISIYLMKIVS